MKTKRSYSANTATRIYARKKRSTRERVNALENSVKLKVVQKNDLPLAQAGKGTTATTPVVKVWKFDRENSGVEFSAMHFNVVNIGGRFNDFSLNIFSSADDFSDAIIELAIRVDSLDTGNEQRDKMLKSEEWLDAEKYPVINFNSTAIKKVGEKVYEITGNIAMRGITHTVSFQATLNGIYTDTFPKKTMAGFTFTTTIDRSKFELGGDAGATGVSNEIDIGANIEFVKE